MVSFRNEYLSCTMTISDDFQTIQLNGAVSNPSKYQFIEIIASNSIDRFTNYSGSGLPFPCANIAFDGTPNIITIDPNSFGTFQGIFSYPNSFYSQDAFEKIKPSIFARLFPKEENTEPIFVRMELPEMVPLQVRTLTHRENRAKLGPEFYSQKTDLIGVRSAYDTMLALKQLKIYNQLA